MSPAKRLRPAAAIAASESEFRATGVVEADVVADGAALLQRRWIAPLCCLGFTRNLQGVWRKVGGGGGGGLDKSGKTLEKKN